MRNDRSVRWRPDISSCVGIRRKGSVMSGDKKDKALMSDEDLRKKHMADPEIQRKIAEAKARIARGETAGDGMSAEELLKLAREQG